jgi:hypothetical protein
MDLSALALKRALGVSYRTAFLRNKRDDCRHNPRKSCGVRQSSNNLVKACKLAAWHQLAASWWLACFLAMTGGAAVPKPRRRHASTCEHAVQTWSRQGLWCSRIGLRVWMAVEPCAYLADRDLPGCNFPALCSAKLERHGKLMAATKQQAAAGGSRRSPELAREAPRGPQRLAYKFRPPEVADYR